MNSFFAISTIHSNKNLEADDFDRSVTVDTSKAHYKGKPWHQLSNFDKRKFENLIILAEPNIRTKVLYH